MISRRSTGKTPWPLLLVTQVHDWVWHEGDLQQCMPAHGKMRTQLCYCRLGIQHHKKEPSVTQEVQWMRSCTDTCRGTGLSSSTEHGFGFSTSLFQLSQLSVKGKVSSSFYPVGTLSKLSFSTGVFSRDPPQAIQLCHPCSVAKAVI